MVNGRFGLGSGMAVIADAVGDGNRGTGGVYASVVFGSGTGTGANKKRLIFAIAASSLSNTSLSFFNSLKRLRRRSKLPFSNISNAAGCNAQYAPLPGLSGLRGILMKQSLKERLCRSEFCQRCVFRR